MRTLLYARYSSQLQNPRSVADQLAACRARAEAEEWEVVGEFSDAAISGAAGIEENQRPGLAAMLAALETPGAGIAQVLTESTDRIARHQGDAFAVRERIEHAGARLFTLMDGHVDEITGTIKGLFDARHRKDLAQRVRRGHRGVVAQGRSTSGVAYGYRKVARFDDRGEQVRGLREPDPVTAEIVRRIYAEYDAGRSPREIARGLNDEGIPAPRGGPWRASTIAGHRKSGFSILANPVYVGRILYGRTRSVTDPRTRQRSTKAGEETVVEGRADHLRLVDDALFERVQAQLEGRATGPAHRQRRPRHLLSGLGVCGCCGQNWIVTRSCSSSASGSTPKGYFGCSGVVEGSACPNRRLISKDEYQRRVLAELTGQMLAPEAVAAYLEEYRAEHARQAKSAARQRGQLERRRAEAARKVANLVAAVAQGGNEFPEIMAALAQARADQQAAEKEIAAADALPQLALHPGLADHYRKAIANLAEELAEEHTRQLAAPKLRKLIARVIVTPSQGTRGVDLEVVRHIDEVLTLATRRTA